MATNPLRVAHRSALRVDRRLEALFARAIGTKEAHPRGRIVAAYAQARRALAGIDWGAFNAMREALDVVNTLRAQLYDAGRLAVPEAVELGRASAAEQVAAYQADGVPAAPAYEYPDRGAMESGWQTAVDSHLDPITALILAGAEVGLILGDEGGRVGALSPGAMQTDASYWLAFAVAAAFAAWLAGREGRKADGIPFQRQAVPAIDNRTTPCCLDVARRGEVVAMDKPFYTPEPPAYNRRQMWAPFHNWCRTSIVLYLPQYDDGITAALQASATAEIGRR